MGLPQSTIQGLVIVPFWGFWTSLKQVSVGDYIWLYLQYLGDVQLEHLPTPAISSTKEPHTSLLDSNIQHLSTGAPMTWPIKIPISGEETLELSRHDWFVVHDISTIPMISESRFLLALNIVKPVKALAMFGDVHHNTDLWLSAVLLFVYPWYLVDSGWYHVDINIVEAC